MSAARDRLAGVLYTLIRDEVTPGKIEKLVQDLEAHPPPYEYTNKHLAGYAQELADRILTKQTT